MKKKLALGLAFALGVCMPNFSEVNVKADEDSNIEVNSKGSFEYEGLLIDSNDIVQLADATNTQQSIIEGHETVLEEQNKALTEQSETLQQQSKTLTEQGEALQQQNKTLEEQGVTIQKQGEQIQEVSDDLDVTKMDVNVTQGTLAGTVTGTSVIDTLKKDDEELQLQIDSLLSRNIMTGFYYDNTLYLSTIQPEPEPTNVPDNTDLTD